MSALDLDDGRAFAGLDEIEQAQVRRCLRTLLRRPLLRAGGPEADVLPLVRRYRERLQSFFSGYLGYRLVVEPSFARLHKVTTGRDGTRGALTPGGAPFTPRAYAYLALTLAVLTGAGGQLLLSGLVDEVRAAAREAGLEPGTDITERRALVAALRHLVELGVLAETDGTVAPWADDTSAEALITVDIELLRHVLATPRVAADDAEELLARATRPVPGGERHAVRRRLVDDPVLHRAELTMAEADWLRAHLRREAELAEEALGLRVETRAEGVVAIDPDGYLTDLTFPGTGTVSRVALLALPELLGGPHGETPGGVRQGDDAGRNDGWRVATAAALLRVCTELVERYPAAWSKDAVDDPRALAGRVRELLLRAGLARPFEDGALLLSPAAHRYLPVPDEAPPEAAPSEEPPGPGPGQEAMFGDLEEMEGAR